MILKISLKPLDRFFFGGENGFQEAGGEEDDRRTTYILHSRDYPQQTGVLGLIRNQLLLQNGLLWDNTAGVSNKAAASVLIGKHSFQKGYPGPYGAINTVGPVFLCSADGAQWLPAPLDDVPMKKEEITSTMTLRKQGKRACLEGFIEKSGCYSSLQRQGTGLTLDDAFTTAEQVGITKAARPWGNEVGTDDDERGYYYQGFKQFSGKNKTTASPDRFAFYLHLEEKCSLGDRGWTWTEGQSESSGNEGRYSLRSGIVEFGGERSTFWMEVERTTLSEFPVHQCAYHHTSREAGIRSLVCLSPSWVDTIQLLQHALLIVSQTLSFRFLKSKMEAGNGDTQYYQALARKNDKDAITGALLESKLYHLLDRGSVIHFLTPPEIDENSTEEKIKSLFNQADMQHIGYNHFCII